MSNRNYVILEMCVEQILIGLLQEATERVALSDREYKSIYENTLLYCYSLLNEFPNLLREPVADLRALEANIQETARRILKAQHKLMTHEQVEDLSQQHSFVFVRELLREIPNIMEYKYA